MRYGGRALTVTCSIGVAAFPMEGETVEVLLQEADRAKVARLWLLGPDEVAAGHAKCRDLATGEESEVPL